MKDTNSGSCLGNANFEPDVLATFEQATLLLSNTQVISLMEKSLTELIAKGKAML